MASKAASKIGPGVVVRGTIRGDGDLTVEGRVEGSLDVTGDVQVEASARIRAAVAGDRITVRGAVAGDIRGSESVVLEDGARVVGDLNAPSVGIRPGGLLRGYVSTTGKSAPTGRTQAGGAKVSRSAPVATPAPRAQRPASLQRGREEAATTLLGGGAPAASQRAAVKGPALPKPPARAPHSSPPSQKAPPPQGYLVEPIASPMTRPTGSPARGAASREAPSRSDGAGPPPPVVPALKKGARGSMKKKAGR